MTQQPLARRSLLRPRTITLGSAGTLVVPSNTAVTGLTSGTGYSLTNLVTVSGGTLYKVFTVNAGTKAAALASLNIINYTDVTVSQYALTSAGAVANNGGTLTITSSTLSNDGAQTSPSGAIQNQGTITLINSTLGNNYIQSNAAGIENNGTLTMSTDQRGLPRSATYTAGKCYDSGAVQTLYSFYFATQPPPT